MIRKCANLVIAVLTIAVVTSKAGPPTAADVGEVGSFGHAALYMGAKSGFVQLSPDPCPPSSDPASRCFELGAAPAPTTFSADDIIAIRLPKKATRTIIYPMMNFFLSYQLSNTTGVDQPQGLFLFRAEISIESPALLDPSVIDPGTGLPAGGRITRQFSYNYRDDRNMRAGDRQRTQITLVRAGNAGINKASLVEMGIPAAVVDSMFENEMTVRMSISGSARLATDASLTGNLRLFGD